MRSISSEHVIYAFSPENPAAAEIALGEDFVVETLDCYGGAIKTERDLRTEIKLPGINPATGPIAFAGVLPGEIICVEVKEISVADQGVMVAFPSLGPLGDMIHSVSTKIIPVKDKIAHFSDTISMAVSPMIGVLGVAPAAEALGTVSAGNHGGNMDTKDITAGAKVYFPVFVPGAMLALGDLHALMGDGELSGTGIEICGRVHLTVNKVIGPAITTPVIETPEAYMIVGSAETFEAAYRKVLIEAVQLFQQTQELSFDDAYRLLSIIGDLKISQIVNPVITVRVAFPKVIVGNLFNP